MALPLVLVALVITSILVSAMLVTSSTELAISHAHRDATQALFRADTGLRSFVAAQDWNTFVVPTDPIPPYTPPGAPAEDAVRITVSRLLSSPPSVPGPQIFSVLATPVEGGSDRTVGVLVETLPPTDPLLPPPDPRVFGWFEVVR